MTSNVRVRLLTGVIFDHRWKWYTTTHSHFHTHGPFASRGSHWFRLGPFAFLWRWPSGGYRRLTSAKRGWVVTMRWPQPVLAREVE